MKTVTAQRALIPAVAAAMWAVIGCGVQAQITPDMAGVSTAALATMVMFDDERVESTPCHFNLDDRWHQVIIRMPGFEAYSAESQRAARVWSVDGTLVGDFVGLAVDA